MVISASDLLRKPKEFCGVTMSVSGRLMIDANNICYLAVDYSGYVNGERMLLDDQSQILDHVINNFPLRGGGEVLCDEKMMLAGTVVKNGDVFNISNISYCRISSHLVETEVPLR